MLFRFHKSTLYFLPLITLFVLSGSGFTQAASYYSSGSGEFSTIFPLAGLADGDQLFIQNGHILTVNGINDYTSIANLTITIQSGGVLELNDILGILALGTGSQVVIDSGGELRTTGLVGGITTAITISGGGIIPPAYSPLFGDANPTTGPASITSGGTIILQELYSIVSGDWNTSGTWSTASGGSSCGCIPTANDLTIVENGFTVNITGNVESAGLTILNGGRVQWTAPGTLTIRNSGNIAIESVGFLDENGQTGANIFLDNTSASSIASGGDVTIDALTYNDNTVPVHITSSSSFILSSTLFAAANAEITNAGSGLMAFLDVDGSNLDFNFNNHGTITMGGAFLNMGGNEVINNHSGGVWNYFGTSSHSGTALYCDVDGANTFLYNQTGAQDIIVPQDSYWHLELRSSGTKSLIGNINIKGNFTVADGSTVTFNPATFGVTFNGTAAQTLQFSANPGGFTFYNLTLNNTSGAIPAILISNGSEVLINNSMTFTAGVMDVTGTVSGIRFPTGTSISPAGGAAGSYIDGTVVKEGTTAFTFPTGDGNVWAPIGISAPTASSTFTGQYFFSQYPDLTTDGSFSHVSAAEYWVLNRTAGTGNTNVSLFWKDDTRSEIVDLTDLRVARWDGTQWVSEGQNSNSGTITPAGWVESNQVTSFSPFTFASQNGLNPLPINLTSFAGRQEAAAVSLTWETASEINNNFFTLERSYDGENFRQIAIINGSGTTSDPVVYKYSDYPTYSGIIYYRLTQTDFDGTSETFAVIGVKYEINNFSIQVYPNPVVDQEVTVLLPANLKGKVQISIYSLTGTVVFQQEYLNPESRLLITFDHRQPGGLYLLQVSTETGSFRTKLYKE